jgi:DNA-binding response OmpR family regulator
VQVKPFGRQEIIARINAHMRFRSAVMELAEVEGAHLSRWLRQCYHMRQCTHALPQRRH